MGTPKISSAVILCGLALFGALRPSISAQATGPKESLKKAKGSSKAVSLPHLYWHFLIYQHQLDQMAAEHEKEGQDGRWLRSYLQTKISMNDAEFQPIRESADRMAVAIAAVNAEAKAVLVTISAFRNQDGTLSPEGERMRMDLKGLTAKRETAILAEIDTLNAALTPEAQSSLRNYLTKTFSNSVKIVPARSDNAGARPFHKPLPAEVRP